MLAGRTTHIDESFGDILDNLDIGFMGVAEARYERFGVFTDLVYVKLSDSGDTPFGILANSVDFTTKSLMWTAAGEYRLLDQSDASVDAFAGFRLFSIENELDFNPPGLLGGLELSQTETWADPIVGLKGRLSVTPQIYLTSWGLIGGGASSDLVWDVMAGAGYQFTETFSVEIGYRAAGVDYSNDGFVYDVGSARSDTGRGVSFLMHATFTGRAKRSGYIGALCPWSFEQMPGSAKGGYRCAKTVEMSWTAAGIS